MNRPTHKDAGRRRPLYRGYRAPCSRCGAMVVHAESTGEPFHMHARSKKCEERAAGRAMVADRYGGADD